MPNEKPAHQHDPKVGLCTICNHASTLTSAKGTTFWRCNQSDLDTTIRRYPTLPVEDCQSFKPGSPKTGTLPAR